ncbi:VOC family protein [Micromonospora sp. NPDC047134]|uniref:VOC family protein n=1 Tax=Micromonospora sp. NPDC047134 TaxID=3154340 RepID=UPI0033F93095
MRLSYVRLMVEDYATCFTFYRDVIGLKVTYGDEHSRYAEFEIGSGTQLALNKREVMAKALGTEHADHALPGQDRFALILEVEDVDSTAAELVSRGANMIQGPSDRPGWGIRSAYFRDPDGYLIEINKQQPEED